MKRFLDGEAQVLIGTQMVAKGLHVPNVSLVGVVLADIGGGTTEVGLVSLGHALFFGLGAYTLALASPDFSPASMWWMLPLVMLLLRSTILLQPDCILRLRMAVWASLRFRNPMLLTEQMVFVPLRLQQCQTMTGIQKWH